MRESTWFPHINRGSAPSFIHHHYLWSVIAQFVARSNGYEIEGQTGITGTYPTQCHHDGEVLSL
jgi:hypothetical protein